MALLSTFSAGRATQAAPKRWYKGNLHTHTLNSDGDSAPNVVAAWYKDNGYQFLVLSDHNVLTEVSALNAALGVPEKYLLIPGEEVTDQCQGRPVHVNGYGLSSMVKPPGGDDLVATIQRNVDAIRTSGGLPSVNHPNFRWAFSSEQLLAIERLNLFEVYNGHPLVHNRGGGGGESLEEMWDRLLSAGRRIYGIAVDDAHNFKSIGKNFSNPGRGWVVVRSAELAAASILAALDAGDFYSSTGVELEDVRRSESELRVVIRASSDVRHTTCFIGENGQVLGKSFDNEAVYVFQGGEKYVRAVVRGSNGDDAWTQPVFLN